MKRLAVYCGSNMGADSAFADVAQALGEAMAGRGIGLVYGGGKRGLMGVVADAVLAGGGEVTGVIPAALLPLEVAHAGLTRLETVGSLHQRKARMTDLADAFVALPGGIGTFDELFEAWTWNALGYHAKPVALLNVAGFWDALLSFLDHSAASGFMSPVRRAQLLVAIDPDDVIERLSAAAQGATRRMTW